MNARYRGRFAPSPTGPLHFGSLVAAVASYLEAIAHDGEWLVRIEDLDPPRVVPRAADAILRTLEACGMEWSVPVVSQSARNDAYHAALHELRQHGRVYVCACSRREIADSALSGIEGFVYLGTCRSGLPANRAARAWRVDTSGSAITFEDAIQGRIVQNIATAVGDFVVYRADGVYAYQLAVAVDDAEQGITHVVRGADLLDSTARQIFLQRLLNLATPAYAHVPIAVNARGEKLSKQTHAAPVQADEVSASLTRALRFLGQDAPGELDRAPVADVWTWAKANWRLDRVPRMRSLHANGSD
jgi:glutamyl-Q tRNA(Asp) synthetase